MTITPRDTGEPAFCHDRGGPYKAMYSGITVRDYFAAAALPGLIRIWGKKYSSADLAKEAFIFADMMCRERDT